MKVFVTGGNGFIGSFTVRELLKAGHQVKCLVRETSDTSRLEGLEWEKYIGDVRDRDSILEGAKGCDAIVHLASPSSWNDIKSPHMKAIVEDGTRNVLEAGKAYDIRVLYCSSGSTINGTDTPVVGDETTKFTLEGKDFQYAISKLEAEHICLDYFENEGVDVVIVNPAEVYGPEDTGLVTAGNLVEFIKSPVALVTNGGTSVVHVEDVALGIVAALDKGRAGERYILGGENLTVREMAERTLALAGKSAPIIALPSPVIKGFFKFCVTFGLPTPLVPEVIPYAVKYWFMDSSKAEKELGVTFRPADEVFGPTIAWLKTSGHI